MVSRADRRRIPSPRDQEQEPEHHDGNENARLMTDPLCERRRKHDEREQGSRYSRDGWDEQGRGTDELREAADGTDPRRKTTHRGCLNSDRFGADYLRDAGGREHRGQERAENPHDDGIGAARTLLLHLAASRCVLTDSISRTVRSAMPVPVRLWSHAAPPAPSRI